MKTLIRSLILAPAVLMATAAFAADTSNLNVPFSFTSHGKSYPAGDYTVTMNSNHEFATLRSNTEISKSIHGTLAPSNGNPDSPASVRLEFSSTGDGHELRRIRYGAFSTADMTARRTSNGETIDVSARGTSGR